MPTSFITTNTIVPFGVAVSLATNTNYHVLSGVVVGSETNDAMSGTDGNISVQVAGSVIGNSAGIRLGDTGDDYGYRIEVASSGYLSGGTTAGTGGVRVFGQSAAVVNQGMISGYYGIVMGGTVTGAVSEIFNSGVVTAMTDAILRVFGSTDTLHIVNTGSIVAGADRAALNHNFTDAVEQVVNSGSILGDLYFGLGNDSFRGLGGSVVGDILMGDGADKVDNLGGLIDGDVFLGSGVDVYNGAGGTVNGTVYGEADNDTFFVGAGADSYDGGTGADYLDFGKTGATQMSLDDSIDFSGSSAGDTYTGFEHVYGSAFDDVIYGSAGANLLVGRAGNDTINGGGGGDTLRGGTGIDTLTGGLGNDRFQYLALADCGDTITDFNNVTDDDAFYISAAKFGGGLVAGTLAANQFRSRADNAAQDADDRFIFRTTDKTLWYDADGNGAGAAIMVADLNADASLTNLDIVII